jgi:hypothetical protein
MTNPTKEQIAKHLIEEYILDTLEAQAPQLFRHIQSDIVEKLEQIETVQTPIPQPESDAKNICSVRILARQA